MFDNKSIIVRLSTVQRRVLKRIIWNEMKCLDYALNNIYLDKDTEDDFGTQYLELENLFQTIMSDFE